jgi:hypothetical protein
MFVFAYFTIHLAMIGWKECEHEFDEIVALQIPRVREALQNYRLLKYFNLQNMRKEVLLLEYLIGLWDDVEQEFRI